MRHACIGPLLAAMLVASPGCNNQPSPKVSRAVVPRLDEAELLQQDDLQLGTEFLHRVNDPNRFLADPLTSRQNPYALPEIDRLALYHLNQWLAREAKNEFDWKPPEMRIPKEFAEMQAIKELNRMRFTRDDLEFLQGRVWQRDIVRRVSSQTTQALEAASTDQNLSLERRLLKSTASIAGDNQHQLAIAVALFDWTIRNIQLEPYAEDSEETVTGVGESPQSPRSQRGVPGRGYLRLPYDTMLFGRGDAIERARVFMELCRAADLETVMLAPGEKSITAEPWAVGVTIGDDLFLFDAELGLPVRNAEGGIATIAQVLADGAVLDQMDIGEKRKYRVNEKDFSSLWLLISASPEEMSKRMWLLDRSVTGAKHLRLYVNVDGLAQRLTKMPGVKNARAAIWKVPLECTLYDSFGRGVRLSKDADFNAKYGREALLLDKPLATLRQARQLQFQGTFDTPEEVHTRRREAQRKGNPDFGRDGGAVEIYLANRPEERGIEELAYSDYWQKRFSIPQLPPDPEQRRKIFAILGSQVQRVRQDTSYWIALVQSEKEDFRNAITWFKGLGDSDENPWLTGTRYNLARGYEALGEYDEAIKVYRSDDSVQQYGNRLRAKWLSELQQPSETAER